MNINGVLTMKIKLSKKNKIKLPIFLSSESFRANIEKIEKIMPTWDASWRKKVGLNPP